MTKVRSLFKPNPAAVLDPGMKGRPTRITGREILSYVPDLTHKDEFEKILIFELAQDTGNRRRYADSLWWLVVFWLGGISIFLAVDGILNACKIPFLSDKVILALIGGTTASVLALFTIVAHFLFPSNEDLFAVVANSKFPSAGSITPPQKPVTYSPFWKPALRLSKTTDFCALGRAWAACISGATSCSRARALAALPS